MTSADAGASFHYNFPSNYGDVHVGVYNGENYNRSRGRTIRRPSRFAARSGRSPRRHAGAARPARAPGSTTTTTTSRTQSGRARSGSVTFEHQYLNAGFDYLSANDQTSGDQAPTVEGRGYSILGDAEAAEEPMGRRWEALLRYDHLTPNTEHRDVAGRAPATRLSAWPTGSRTRATSSTAPCCSTTTARRSTTITPQPARRRSPCTGWSTSKLLRRLDL